MDGGNALEELWVEGIEERQPFVCGGMGGHEAAEDSVHGSRVAGRVGASGERGIVEGRLQLAESVFVIQVAANVGGRALVQLVLGGFDGLFN